MSDIASPSSSTRHDLNGKNAVVTGSSSGIGHAIALELSKAGANVLIHARSNQPAAEATAAMIRASGHESTVVVIDLADLAGQDELVQRAWNWREGIDVWVNNAGADVLTGERSRWSFDRKLDLLWRVDVVGTIRLARQIGQLMQQRKPPSGVILNMGWDP